jgi:hypothetical protein
MSLVRIQSGVLFAIINQSGGCIPDGRWSQSSRAYFMPQSISPEDASRMGDGANPVGRTLCHNQSVRRMHPGWAMEPTQSGILFAIINQSGGCSPDGRWSQSSRACCTESDSFLNHPHPAIGLIEPAGFFVVSGLALGRPKMARAQELGICFPAFLLHEVGK